MLSSQYETDQGHLAQRRPDEQVRLCGRPGVHDLLRRRVNHRDDAPLVIDPPRTLLRVFEDQRKFLGVLFLYRNHVLPSLDGLDNVAIQIVMIH
jgi:hypothetical protein